MAYKTGFISDSVNLPGEWPSTTVIHDFPTRLPSTMKLVVFSVLATAVTSIALPSDSMSLPVSPREPANTNSLTLPVPADYSNPQSNYFLHPQGLQMVPFAWGSLQARGLWIYRPADHHLGQQRQTPSVWSWRPWVYRPEVPGRQVSIPW